MTELETRIIAHLEAHRGRKFAVFVLAKHLSATNAPVRNAVERLVRADKIRASLEGRNRMFYLPTPEQMAELQALQDKQQPVVRRFSEYQVPKFLAERVNALRSHRDQFPSFYGNGGKA